MKRVVDCVEAFKWLKANGHSLAGLTGQDRRALEAIAHCWVMYAASDGAGEVAALGAVRSLLIGMQAKERYLAKELIAFALDWNDRDPLWDRVAL